MKKRQYLYGYLFISLWIIGYLIFSLYPIIFSFILSLQSAHFTVGGYQGKFIGFDNFISIFRNQNVLPLLVSYLGQIIIAVPLIIVFALIIALLINQPIKGKGLWRTIFFLPVVISTGPVIRILISQGATTLPSLENNTIIEFIVANLGENVANPIMTILESLLLILWYAGIPILIFLAALQKTEKSIYEAAKIDGASPWDIFWKITLPAIMPFITVNIIYVVVNLSIMGDIAGVLSEAALHASGDATNIRYFGYGYSSALTWIYFIMMVLVILIYVGLITIGGRREARHERKSRKLYKLKKARLKGKN